MITGKAPSTIDWGRELFLVWLVAESEVKSKDSGGKCAYKQSQSKAPEQQMTTENGSSYPAQACPWASRWNLARILLVYVSFTSHCHTLLTSWVLILEKCLEHGTKASMRMQHREAYTSNECEVSHYISSDNWWVNACKSSSFDSMLTHAEQSCRIHLWLLPIQFRCSPYITGRAVSIVHRITCEKVVTFLKVRGRKARRGKVRYKYPCQRLNFQLRWRHPPKLNLPLPQLKCVLVK